MTKTRLQRLLLAAVLTVLAGSPALAQVKTPEISDDLRDKVQPLPAGKLPVNPRINPKVLERATACADPATVDLTGNLVSRSSRWPAFQGTIDIVGVVRNVGRANYVSGRGQQSVELLEESPGETPRVVRTASFTNLNAGGDVRVTYQRDWDVAREFPPRYMLRISYGPDIRIDGNAANDDCRLNNNEATIEPRQIDVLFE